MNREYWYFCNQCLIDGCYFCIGEFRDEGLPKDFDPKNIGCPCGYEPRFEPIGVYEKAADLVQVSYFQDSERELTS